MLDWVSENLVSAICFAFVLGSLAQAFFLKKDFFRPTNIYIFTQCLTLGIAYLKFDPSMSDFKPMTWFIYLGAMFSFILGDLTFDLVHFRGAKAPRKCDFKNSEWKKSTPFSNVESSEFKQSKIDEEVSLESGEKKERLKKNSFTLGLDFIKENYRWKKHFQISCLIFILFLIACAEILLTSGFYFTASIHDERPVYSTFSNTLFFSSPLVVILFASASFRSVNPYKKIRFASILLACLTVVIALLVYPGRNALFLSIGMVVILYNFLKRRVRVRFIVGALAIGVVFFLGVAMAREQFGGSSLRGLAASYIMKLPYRYVANNFWNLDYALNSPPDNEIHPFTYGVDALSGVFEYAKFPASMKEIFGWDDAFNGRIIKKEGYNTVSYLWELYKDFGVAGTILGPFFWAFLLAYIYSQMNARPKIPLILLYTFFLYYTGFSFFTAWYKFGHVWLWIWSFLLFEFLCGFPRKGKSEGEEKESGAENRLR